MNVTPETLDLIKAAIANGDEALAKAISQATGLTAYDLQAPAKNLYPVNTPLRNAIPRIGGGIGTATNWKSVRALLGSGYDAMGWVPEGQRSARMGYTTENKSATYVTLGEEDSATMEAINAGKGFEDIQARMTMRLLQKTMLKEENAILGGNASVALTTPSAPTVSASGSGNTLGAATYVVYCVALTYEGFKNSSLANGVATSQTITGADGDTFVLNGGSSNKSSASSGQAVSSGQALFASVPVVNGAVAYAWYVGTSGNEKLEAITTINSVKFTTALVGTGQAASAISADKSRNANYAFDGLLYSAFASGSGAYINALATGTAGTGTVLTGSGRGSIVEIDTALKSMWDNYQVSPTVIYVNSQELKNITDKVLVSGSSPLLRYNQSANGNEPMAVVAGNKVSYYYNPFTSSPGGVMIPVVIHPTLPPGTILLHVDNLPVQYQSNEVPNVAEMKVRQDYYQIDWPLKSRKREVGVYCEEVLAVYAPFALGIITNIANG